MTIDEAINELQKHKNEIQHDFGWNRSTIEAIDFALNALERRKFHLELMDRWKNSNMSIKEVIEIEKNKDSRTDP